MKRTALYLRVSKNEQTIDNQRLELERMAARGWKIVSVFRMKVSWCFRAW